MTNYKNEINDSTAQVCDMGSINKLLCLQALDRCLYRDGVLALQHHMLVSSASLLEMGPL